MKSAPTSAQLSCPAPFQSIHHDFAEVEGLFVIYLVIDKLSNLKKFELDIELSKLLDKAEGYFDFP